MDFKLIEEHPWKTTAIIVAGAILLYILLHRGGGGGAASGGSGTTYVSASNPNADAAAVASQQIQASLAGLQYQGQTQIGLKQLDLQGLQYQTSAAVDVTNRQTDAELALGLGSQQSQVQIATLAAGIQMASIEAIERAYGVLNGPTGPNNIAYGGAPVSAPVNQVGSYPTSSVSTPIYTTQTPAQVSVASSGNGILPPGEAGRGYVIPGGTQLVPTPNYPSSDPSQYPGTAGRCSPLDAECVALQAQLSNQYHADVAQAQTLNNLTQLVTNYQLSASAGVITPAQQAEMTMYENQLTAMGGTVPSYQSYQPAKVYPSQVNTY